MPLIFLILGIIFIIAAVRNTQPSLFANLQADFTGANNFFIWVIAIFAIGAIGYINGLRTLSNALLLLVVAVIILSNKGFFSQFAQQTGISSSTTA